MVLARMMPTTFWSTARTQARPKNVSSGPPPFLTRAALAPIPMVVKNMIMKPFCRTSSNSNPMTPFRRRTVVSPANRSPPTTGAGMLKRMSSGMRCRMAVPMK